MRPHKQPTETSLDNGALKPSPNPAKLRKSKHAKPTGRLKHAGRPHGDDSCRKTWHLGIIFVPSFKRGQISQFHGPRVICFLGTNHKA